jgi:DUF1365 family protein
VNLRATLPQALRPEVATGELEAAQARVSTREARFGLRRSKPRHGPTLAAAVRREPVELGSSASLHSAIYEGWVRHRRHAPHAHAFRYRLCMLWVDLAELDRVFAGRRFWSIDRRNLAEFRRSDYLGDPALPLADAVRERVRAETGRAPGGPIRLLAHLRYFGHCFNPVSFYYCYEEDGVTLACIVAEITNTPWKERHSYVLPVDSAQRHGHAFAWAFRKAFHVSPFLPLQRDYAWRFTVPDSALHVHMDVLNGSAHEFDATMVLERRELGAANLARVLWRYPAMTLRVVAAIHWQALRVWLRRNPVYQHP